MIGRFRRQPHRHVVVVSVPISTVHRQMLYDGMHYDNIPAMADLAGLSPVSEEVDEMERRDSEERLEQIAHVVPCLVAQATFMGELAVATQCKAMAEAGVEFGADEVEEMARATLMLLTTTLVSSVSTAVGLGLLEIPEVIREQ